MSAVIFTAKGAKTANKKGSVPRKPLLHSQKVFAQREPSLPCLKSPATGAFSLSPILPLVVAQNLRKFVLVCFSMFASFALFAVHDSKPECSLKISPRKARKPRTKKGGTKESFHHPSREGTRAVKEEEALVRTVRVVRGSCFSSRVFVSF